MWPEACSWRTEVLVFSSIFVRRTPETYPVWQAPLDGVYSSIPCTKHERHATKTQVAGSAPA